MFYQGLGCVVKVYTLVAGWSRVEVCDLNGHKHTQNVCCLEELFKILSRYHAV